MTTFALFNHAALPTQPWESMNLAERSDLWGIGQAWIPAALGGPQPYPLSHADMRADTAWMEDRLEAMGVAEGDVGYVSYMNDKIAQHWPLFLACVSLGVPLATGMDLRFDAGRLEMFLRRLPIKFVFGLSHELVTGMRHAGFNLREVLSKAPVHVVCQDAWAEFDTLDLPYWRALMLGPALALESPQRDGFVFDAKEWRLRDDDDGHLRITSHPSRACGFHDLNTGVQGRLVKNKSEWRIELTAS